MAGAFAALACHAQFAAQVPHGPRAVFDAGADVVFSDVIAEADIHGTSVKD